MSKKPMFWIITAIIAVIVVLIVVITLTTSKNPFPTRSWRKVEKAILNCQVRSITVDRSSKYIIYFKDGAVESFDDSQLGDIRDTVKKANEKCDKLYIEFE